MSRLIDADALQKEYQKEHGKRLLLIDVAPTIDAVEVVRCENCKHCMIVDYYTSDDEKYVTLYHCKLYDNVLKNNDDYCNYGERREE